jgi:hypothetical protein
LEEWYCSGLDTASVAASACNSGAASCDGLSLIDRLVQLLCVGNARSLSPHSASAAQATGCELVEEVSGTLCIRSRGSEEVVAELSHGAYSAAAPALGVGGWRSLPRGAQGARAPTCCTGGPIVLIAGCGSSNLGGHLAQRWQAAAAAGAAPAAGRIVNVDYVKVR